MQTVLITGGTGYIGGRVVQALSSQHHCIITSRKTQDLPKELFAKNVQQIVYSSILETDTFPSNIDTVIHLAAMNEIECVKNPDEAIEVNIKQTNCILENAIKKGVKNFIYFSTAHVYKSPLVGFINEETLPMPIHPYAITHKGAEDFVYAAHHQKKINAVIFRLSNAFGAPLIPNINRWTLLVSDLCKQAIEQGYLALLSNGCQWRNFIGIQDVAQAVAYTLNHFSLFDQTIYNLGSQFNLRVIDMVHFIKAAYHELFFKDLSIRYLNDATPSNEPPLDFSINRLLATGYTPSTNIQNEIKELLIFCNTHFKKPIQS